MRSHYGLRSPTKYYPRSSLTEWAEMAVFVVVLTIVNSTSLAIFKEPTPSMLVATFFISIIGVGILVKILEFISATLFFHYPDEVMEFEHPKNSHSVDNLTVFDYYRSKLNRRLGDNSITVLGSEVDEDGVYFTVFVGKYYGVLELEHKEVLLSCESTDQQDELVHLNNFKHCTHCNEVETCGMGFIPSERITVDCDKNIPLCSAIALCEGCIQSISSEVSEEKVREIQTRVFAKEV